jgi:hypothetical protein
MSERLRLTVAAVLVLGLGLVSCKKSEAPAAPAPAPAASTPAASATPAAPDAGASLEFGVPECDEYVKKYLACVESNVPAAVKDQVRASFEQTRDMWRRAAATPQGKAGLAQGCKIALDAAKASMTAYGCSF